MREVCLFTEDEKKKDQEKIGLLRYLCQNRPNLFIFAHYLN